MRLKTKMEEDSIPDEEEEFLDQSIDDMELDD